MTKLKNLIRLVIVFCLSFACGFIFINSRWFNLERFYSFATDFHYSVIPFSAIIAGVLFTGICILIAVIDKPRIKRLWDNNYLDNLYYSAFLGMAANVVLMLDAFLLIFLNLENHPVKVFIYIEIISLIVGITFFAWSIKQLWSLILRLKE